MSFIDRLGEITKPKTFEVEYDFGKGDGPEKLTFRAMSYNDRKRIFTDRTKVIGKDDKGNDKWGIDVQKDGIDVNAEILATCWIRPDGKTVASKDAIMQWDADLTNDLATLCMKTTGMADEAKKEDAENPSQPKS